MTTITAASNGAALPQGTLNVASTAGFATSYEGLTVQSSAGPQAIFCTGTDTATMFTSCTGGSGTLATGAARTRPASRQPVRCLHAGERGSGLGATQFAGRHQRCPRR